MTRTYAVDRKMTAEIWIVYAQLGVQVDVGELVTEAFCGTSNDSLKAPCELPT